MTAAMRTASATASLLCRWRGWRGVAFGVQNPTCGRLLADHRRDDGGRAWASASSALLSVTTVPLFLILGYLLYRGGTSLNWDFFTQLPKPVGQTGGGMANAFYGSALMVGLATAFSRAGWPAGRHLPGRIPQRPAGPTVRFVAEMLGSVPSIVIGIFGYYLIVKPITHTLLRAGRRLRPGRDDGPDRHARLGGGVEAGAHDSAQRQLRPGRQPVADGAARERAGGPAGDHHGRSSWPSPAWPARRPRCC